MLSSATTSITSEALSACIGTPHAPHIIDVRIDEDFEPDPRMLPTSRRHDYRCIGEIGPHYSGQTVVVVCQKGLKLSEGVAAILRLSGVRAMSLAGGFEGWRDAGGLLVRTGPLPREVMHGHVWVTRERPKVDRIACPWLIRRFLDPHAKFLFVAAAQVSAVAERFEAIPFDIEGVLWSHNGAYCSFDTMITGFGLTSPPLLHLARIIRGADTAHPELETECAGVLALLLGLSQLYHDDLQQLDAGMLLLDALYAWVCHGRTETHNWPMPLQTV